MTTSREHVLRALSHEETDRTPVDFGGHRSSGISAVAYAKLKKAMGISTGHVYVYDMVQQLAIIEEPVLDALGSDVIEMGRGFLRGDHFWKDWVLSDGTPCKVPHYVNLEQRGQDRYILADDGTALGVQKQGCLYFEQIYFPMEHRPIQEDDFSDLETQLGRTVWATPSPGAHLPLNDSGLAELKAGAQTLRLSTDRAIVGLFGGNLFEIPQMLYRMDNYLMYMGLYPDDVERLSAALCDIYLANLEKWLGAVGDSIDIVLFGDDLGGQNGPLISADMYRRFYKPFHTKMCERVKAMADVKIMLHCCGSIEPFLTDLIEAGMDAINPVQISCRGMDSKVLKARYGDRLTFWGGGCDTHHLLPFCTPQEVQKHVREQIATLSPDGGFVFQQVHNIQANVPPENILAMFAAVNA
jgi:uroporphyrinogen decarboxylase